MEKFENESGNKDIETSDAINGALENFNDDKCRVKFMAPEACETDRGADDGADDEGRFTVQMSPDILVLDELFDEKPMAFGTFYDLKLKFFVPNQNAEKQRELRINMIFD